MESQHRHDISDEFLLKIEPHLPGRKWSWGRVARDNRRFVRCFLDFKNGSTVERSAGGEYGDWKNTHRRFYRWRDKGIRE